MWMDEEVTIVSEVKYEEFVTSALTKILDTLPEEKDKKTSVLSKQHISSYLALIDEIGKEDQLVNEIKITSIYKPVVKALKDKITQYLYEKYPVEE